jgi:hypothetical protein
MFTMLRAFVIFAALAPAIPADDQVADTRFKFGRGFYSEPFLQVIRSNTTGARIRYTLDGSAPSETHGLGDTNPVAVPIETTTTLRAIAYRSGMRSTNVDTQTYIFPADVLKQPRRVAGFPTSIVQEGMGYLVELDTEMDPEIVNRPAYRDEISSALTSIPTLSIVMDLDDLFRQTFMPDGERLDPRLSGVYFGHRGGSRARASVELIDSARPDEAFQVDCGIESHGIRGIKRSLKLRFEKDYGPGKLRSSFLRQAPLNGDGATTQFDRIVLRAGHSRSWAGENPDETTYTRDQWVRDTQVAMSGVGSRGTFVHLYLNGVYWGLYNAVERPDAWFTSAYQGGEKEDWFAINHNGELHGDGARWLYLRGRLKGKDLREPDNYRQLREYLDLAQFADYMILGWYTRLDDWGPGRNWYAGNRNVPPGPLQFFMWDAEYSLFAGAEPMAWIHELYRADARSDSWDVVGLWHSLAQSPDFMTLFADRVYQHCYRDGALTEANAIARWRQLNEFVSDAIIAESARWGDARKIFGEPTRTRDETFLPEVERVVGMMTGNVEHFIKVLREEGYYPTIDPPALEGTRLVNPNGSGNVVYTVDGSDPRAFGGGVSGTAIELSGASTAVEDVANVRARVRGEREWSALATFDSKLQ